MSDKKYVIIRDFLPTDVAEDLSNFIESSKNWHHVHKVYKEDPTYLPLTANYHHKMRALQPTVDKSLISGTFTYRMRRVDKCKCGKCPICVLKSTVLKSPDFLSYLEVMSGLEDLDLTVGFGNIYDRGDFLSIHPDPRYDIAFILNLTKKWRYEYGGCLTVFNDGPAHPPEVILPEFNTLVLMFLGENGVDHYVSEIAQTAPHPRVAVSGWFDRKNK